jgi:hypothetical protein
VPTGGGGVGACTINDGNDNPGFGLYGGKAMDPGQSAVSASVGQTTHFWYLHLDLGALFRL